MSVRQLAFGVMDVPPGLAWSVDRLVRLAAALGAADHGGPLSPAEKALLDRAMGEPAPRDSLVTAVRRAVAEGRDPLGEAFIGVVAASERRLKGAFYTPPTIVEPMVRWALQRDPQRIVDAGCGSGRFAAAVAKCRPDLDIVAVDSDPVATLLCRAHLGLVGARRCRVLHADYTKLDLEPFSGRTAFLGNPPYVRHHALLPQQKEWAAAIGAKLGVRFSRLAGLHVHFFLATAVHARPGDVGCFITSAEWLDVNYGTALRHLLAGWMGAQSLHWINPVSIPFDDAMTTAVITCFEIGNEASPVRCRFTRSRSELGDLDRGGNPVSRSILAASPRWTSLFRDPDPRENGNGFVPLGSLVRVSRGVATGANHFFVMTKAEASQRGLLAHTRPVISSAEEVFQANGVIRDQPNRRVLLDLPAALRLDAPENAPLHAYLAEGERQGIATRYLCAHRRPWWRVGAGNPPPVVATYMARQEPAFALNPDGMAILNVIHGLYPRQPLSSDELAALVRYLNAARASFRGAGRTYHGGLEKFEPREMEALSVPDRDRLQQLAEQGIGGDRV